MFKQIAEYYGLYLEWSEIDGAFVLGDYQGSVQLLPKMMKKSEFRRMCESMNHFA